MTNPDGQALTSAAPLLTVVGPTAAPATIGGRVTTPDGAPLGGVTINLSGPRSAKTITDANGNYRFASADTDNFYGTQLYDGAAMPLANGSGPFTGAYRPDQPLAVLDGQNSAGLWRLNIADVVAAEAECGDTHVVVSAEGPHRYRHAINGSNPPASATLRA